MPPVSLPAHYDGDRIVLDEPYDLPADARLTVMVHPPASNQDVPEAEWLRTAASSDAFTFLADPREDIYTPADGEPVWV